MAGGIHPFGGILRQGNDAILRDNEKNRYIEIEDLEAAIEQGVCHE